MKSQIAPTSMGSIEYTLIGKGSVVLVCHGTSEDCHSYRSLMCLTEAGFSLLTPSRPGYGSTSLDVGRSNLQAAEAFIALLDNLKIQTCSVVAISGGGPTGIALAAGFPERVQSLVLMAAISKPEDLLKDPAYKQQMAFYGPLHAVTWTMLRMVSNLSPQTMARQTLSIFSTHDPDDSARRLTPEGIEAVRQFYQGRSSRRGALNDASHVVGEKMLRAIAAPALIIHSREDKAVPFSHAEWSLSHIPQATLNETGFAGHFFWVDSDYAVVCEKMIAFLRKSSK